MGSRRRSILRSASACVALTLAATACNDDGRDMREPTPDQTASIITTSVAPDGGASSESAVIDSAAAEGLGDDAAATVPGFEVQLPWAESETMPSRFTCAGEALSPPVSWIGLPAGTTDVALVVRTDAGQVHWVATGLTTASAQVVEGADLAGAVVGTNDFGAIGWTAPCPAAGTTALVRFEVHALGQQVEVAPGDTAAVMVAAIDAATIATAVGTGIAVG